MHEDMEEQVGMEHHLKTIQFSLVLGAIMGFIMGGLGVGLFWYIIG